MTFDIPFTVLDSINANLVATTTRLPQAGETVGGGRLTRIAAPALALPAELITRADLIIVNEAEYAPIPELAGAAVVAVTYGAKGSAVLERGEQVAFAPAIETVPVNTVGADDAFCATLTIAPRGRLSYETALHTANAVGAAAEGDHELTNRIIYVIVERGKRDTKKRPAFIKKTGRFVVGSGLVASDSIGRQSAGQCLR